VNKLAADFFVSKLELNFVPRGEPVSAPRLRPLPLPANLTAYQISIIPVSSTPGIIEIVEAVAKGASERVIRVNSFHPQIQLLYLGDVRKVESGVPSGSIDITNR